MSDDEIKVEIDQAEDDSVKIKVEDAPEGEAKSSGDPSVTEGINELRERLEAERKARFEAEKRAYEYQTQAVQSQSDVQDTNLQLINGAIDKLKRENDFMKAELRNSMASGDFDKAADIQEFMSINAAKLLQLENGRVSLEQKLQEKPKMPEPPQVDIVEQAASTLSPRSAAWVRAHPECIRDPNMYRRMVNSHNIAIDDGIEPDSDEYFAYIEQRLGYRSKNEGQNLQSMSAAATPTQKRTAPPAAPTSRSAGSGNSGGNVVRLTAEQKEMAHMMGLKPEEYAKNMMDLKKEGKLQ